MNELAIEMADIMGYAWDDEDEKEALIEKVEEWLLDGGDDGSPAEVLVERFEAEVGSD